MCARHLWNYLWVEPVSCVGNVYKQLVASLVFVITGNLCKPLGIYFDWFGSLWAYVFKPVSLDKNKLCRVSILAWIVVWFDNSTMSDCWKCIHCTCFLGFLCLALSGDALSASAEFFYTLIGNSRVVLECMYRDVSSWNRTLDTVSVCKGISWHPIYPQWKPRVRNRPSVFRGI